MCDQSRFLPRSSAIPLPLALNYSHAGLLAFSETCHVLSNLRAFDFAVPAAWKILPLYIHMIQFLTFFMDLPNVTSSEKSFLKTIFQIIPPCTNPVPSPCFLFLHSISNHPPWAFIVCLLLECKLFESKDFVLFSDIPVVKWMNKLMNVEIKCFFPIKNPLVTLDSKHKFFNLKIKSIYHCTLLFFSKEEVTKHLE